MIYFLHALLASIISCIYRKSKSVSIASPFKKMHRRITLRVTCCFHLQKQLYILCGLCFAPQLNHTGTITESMHFEPESYATISCQREHESQKIWLPTLSRVLQSPIDTGGNETVRQQSLPLVDFDLVLSSMSIMCAILDPSLLQWRHYYCSCRPCLLSGHRASNSRLTAFDQLPTLELHLPSP